MKKIAIVGHSGITTVTERLLSDKCTIPVVVDSENTESLKYFDEEDVYEISQMAEYFPTINRVEQYFRDKPKIGRNAPCPCGSDKKYKKCCM